MKIIQSILICFCLTLSVVGCSTSRDDDRHGLTLDVFKGDFATVNSFVFSNGQSLVVMDVQRKTYEAKKLVDLIKTKNLPLTHILITHGHTDHFTGMPLFRTEFPEAKIVVAV